MTNASSTRSPDEAPSSDQTPRNAKSALQSPLLWLIFLLVLKLAAPFVPVPTLLTAHVLSSVFTLVYAVVLIGFISQAMRLHINLWQRFVAFFAFALLWFLADNLWKFPLQVKAATLQNPSFGFEISLQIARLAVDVLLICAAMFLGSLVAQIFSSPNTLAPFCAFCLVLDVWFVLFGGIASQMAASAPRYAAKVTAAVPAIGMATTSKFAVSPVGIGAADYLLWGLVFAAMFRFSMNWRGAAKWMVLLIGGSLLAVNAGVGMIPGFVSIALSTALPNLKFFKFSREESFALLYAGLFVIALTIGLHFATPFIIERMQQVK